MKQAYTFSYLPFLRLAIIQHKFFVYSTLFVYSKTYSSQLNMFVLKPAFHSVTELINAHANLAAIPPSLKISNALLAIPKLILKKATCMTLPFQHVFFYCTHLHPCLFGPGNKQVLSISFSRALQNTCAVEISLFYFNPYNIRDLVYLVYD